MRNFHRMTAGAVAVALFALAGGCAKPTESMIKARDAIAGAEAAGAPQSNPQLYNQAKGHFDEGERQTAILRYNLARFQYETAAEQAALAAVYSQTQPPGDQTCPPCPELPGACMADLADCNAELQQLRSRLAGCSGKTIVKTRVIREPCDGEPEPAKTSGALLMGTLLWEPPALIQADQTDYQIQVKYVRSMLGEGSAAADNQYKILVDVVDVEPESVDVVSPTVDYEPIADGQWALSMTVPAGTPGPVKVKLGATLMNTVTDREQNLPPVELAIPVAGANATPAPAVNKPPPAAADKKEGGFINLILAALIGIIIGLAIGFVVFKSKGGSTISKSPPLFL